MTINNFNEDFMTKEIKFKWGLFDSLSRADMQSMFEFALMLCSDELPDCFVTPCEILLDNKDNIHKNTGVRIVTVKEAIEIMQEHSKENK